MGRQNSLLFSSLLFSSLLFSSLLFLVLFLNSCKKEELQIQDDIEGEFSFDFNSQIPYGAINVADKGFTGKSGSDKILVFTDMNALENTLNELERQMEDYDDAFISFFSHLNEIELNTKDEEIGFVVEKPLFDFNDFFEYHSLFKKIDEEEKAWLELEDANFDEDPDNHFIAEYAIRAILNEDCEVQVGKFIYKFTEDGYYEIEDDLKSLQLIDMGIDLDYVIFYGDTYAKSSSCIGFRSNRGYKAVNNRRIKWKIGIATYPWKRHVYAKVTNYKKEKKKWKKYRTACSVRVYGHISGSEGDCSTKILFNEANGFYLSKDKKKSAKMSISVQTKTKSGWVKGHHSGAETVYYNSTLTW